MSEKKKNFIGMMAPHVREVAARTGLDPRLILAQSAVETGWGGKAPGNNYFGIKSHNREGGQNFMTTEYIRGAPVKKVQNFREYSGPEESSRDYASFILENPRYQEAMKAKGIDDQIKAIGKSGYATDPRYGRKLRAVALGIELPPEPPPEDRPVAEEQRPVEQREQAPPTEQPPPPEQEAEAVNYNQADPRDEPTMFARGGSANFSSVDHNDPAFRSWFGESVLHDDGVPRTYYHGTSKDTDFKKFKMSRHGIWMTTEPKEASQYALENDSQGFKRDGWDLKPSNTASRVIPVHARIEKPFVGPIPEEYRQDNYKKSQSDWFDALRLNGYDGWVPESQNGKLAVALGHPGQIKSALSNSGEYSETGDINKADGGSVDDQQQRELSPLGFYSHAAEMASQLPQERGSPQQMAGMLTNKYGVKPVEMEGFDEAFAGQPSVTRDQLVQHFTSNMPQIERKVLGGSDPDSDETKYSQYQLPGGENYREVLLKLPYEKKQRVGVLSTGEIMTEEELAYPVVRRTAEKIGLTMEDRMMPTMVPFKSSHYPDPNILAHIRLSDRTGPNNEKILHIEEIQSDWAQKGRKEGFGFAPGEREASEDKMGQLALERNALRQEGSPEALAKADELQNKIRELSDLGNKKLDGVPTAPYVTNTAAWTDLALKHVLHEAAHGDYDKVVWTPGAEQAKRYDLSKQVGKIYYDPELAGGTLAAEGLRPGQTILDKPNIKPENIADYIGKEAAEKLLLQPRDPNGMHMLEGDGLSMGGEGMKGYYDKIVPTQLSKLLKKLDPEARIEAHNLDTRSPADKKMGLPEGQSINTVRAQSIRITPKMRESIKRGFPTYADGGAVDDEDEGLTAYHGSPHDFEQFDTSKIGTGEGAQAYGHGLYFAESEPVAKEYRDKLTAGTYKGDTGQVFDPFRNLEHLNVRNAAYKSIDNAIDRAKGLLEDEDQSHNADMINRDLAKLMEAKAQNAQPQTGRMYEVRINAHPDHFLDWDAPLSQQSEYVRTALEQHSKASRLFGNDMVRGELVEPTGEAILGRLFGRATERSKQLEDLGIKGIRYLDAGSRSSKEGSRNYVVFNHDHVQVKRKYARGGAIAGA